MEKRVIKFSLIGAILVSILIIATIVGSVVLIRKIYIEQKEKNEYQITVQDDNNTKK